MSREIRNITVIGAGAMGRGIAQVAAMGGYRTRLFDVAAPVLEEAGRVVHRNLDKGVELGKVDESTAALAKENLVLDTELEAAAADTDLVIEAVPELLELKIETFQRAAGSAPKEALFATNTSGLSITEMAPATGRPERFAGMHFFNPVHIMKLVELVRGLETADKTVELLREVAERMGKQVVVVNESPGFVTSRINALIGNEAFRMLQEGVASAEDIDTALKLGLNHPMGPFEMVDLVGLDVRYSILKYLHQTLGELYRPNNLLVQYVRAGRLGRKTKRGVYEYDEEGKRTG
ncbi:MAG: 3-hydroxyacyl-CoA dehydrogenase [Acidobacteria bacterium]|nr:MAG: 3-hydroxyacyl-CoA dehydrogenase [Acidobacteriota bacterium]